MKEVSLLYNKSEFLLNLFIHTCMNNNENLHLPLASSCFVRRNNFCVTLPIFKKIIVIKLIFYSYETFRMLPKGNSGGYGCAWSYQDAGSEPFTGMYILKNN